MNLTKEKEKWKTNIINHTEVLFWKLIPSLSLSLSLSLEKCYVYNIFTILS